MILVAKKPYAVLKIAAKRTPKPKSLEITQTFINPLNPFKDNLRNFNFNMKRSITSTER